LLPVLLAFFPQNIIEVKMNSMQATKLVNNFLPQPVPERVQRFDHNDPLAYKYLDEQGYVVIKNAATAEEVQKGISLAWDYLEEIVPGVNRKDLSTYNNPSWPNDDVGVFADKGVGQSALLWFARGLDTVQQIFKKVWNTEHVITSFDGCNIMRPWEYNSSWKTSPGGWYHVDQNPMYKPGKMCIQGFLNFFPSGETDGGLVLIPRSHTVFNEITQAYISYLEDCNDFISLSDCKPFWENVIQKKDLKAIKVCMEPGDFILWDSRLIHCNGSATSARPIPTNGEILPLRRLVAYICMVPTERLPEKLKSERIKAYTEGHTTTHWPEKCDYYGRQNDRKSYVPVQLTPKQKQLIPM